MSLYDGDYIRVLTPQTTDGINLRYVNGKPDIRESHAENTKTTIENFAVINANLPEHLKHKLEFVYK